MMGGLRSNDRCLYTKSAFEVHSFSSSSAQTTGDFDNWVPPTYANIAFLCDVSVRTVHKHLQHGFDRLNVENRSAAARAVRSICARHLARRRRLLFASSKLGSCILCDLPDCTNVEEIELRSAQWAPDGRGVAYISEQDHSNLWEQPLDGGPAHAVTHFADA